jgi:hypothetical protein
MSCGTAGYDHHRVSSTGLEATAVAASRRSLRPMFFTLSAFAFAVGALILFIFAFRAVFAGKIGNAVIFGLLGLVLSGAAGATAVAA